MTCQVVLEFGGLVMFVRDETKRKKLFVLMPALKHPHMDHKAMVANCDPVTGEPIRKASLEKKGKAIDLTSQLPAAGTGSIETNYFAPLSRVARKNRAPKPVRATFLDDAPDDKRLLARIELALGHDVKAHCARAELEIDVEEDGNLITKPFDLAGLARITTTVADDAKLDFGGFEVPAVAGGALYIKIANILGGNFKPGKEPHEVGQPVHHFYAYYRLLEPGRMPTPRSRTDGDQPDCPAGAFTSDQRSPYDPERKPPLRSFFVNPFQCTIGFGCPPEQPEC
jgi:hypothetical protein